MLKIFLFAQTPTQLESEKKYFSNNSGKLFAPCELPVYLSISSEANGGGISTQVKKDNSNPPMYLSEGKNTICNNMSVSSPNGTRIVKQCYDLYGDGTAPSSKLLFQNANTHKTKQSVYFGKKIEISLESEDKLSGVAQSFVSLNSDSYQSYKNFNWNLNDGKYELYYYSIDNVGNLEEPKYKEFFIDYTSPETEIIVNGLAKDSVLSNEATISLVAKDSLSGVKTIYYQINNSIKKKYSKPITLIFLEAKEHVLTYYAEDNVGNIEVLKTWNFIYDTNPPIAEINVIGESYINDQIIFVATQPQLYITAKDSVSEIKNIDYIINYGETHQYLDTFLLPNISGLYRVSCYVTDSMNNQSKEKTENIYIDNTAPKTYYQTTKSCFWSNDTLIITNYVGIVFTATDMESGIKNFNLQINDTSLKYNSDTLFFPKDGIYNVGFFSVDNVNNTEERHDILVRASNNMLQTRSKAKTEAKQWLLSGSNAIGSTDLSFYIRISDSPDENADSYLVHIDNEDKDNKISEPLMFEKSGNNQIKMQVAGFRPKFDVKIDGVAPSTKAIFEGSNRYARKADVYYGTNLKLKLQSKDYAKGIVSGVDKIYYSINGSKFDVYKKQLDVFGREQKYIIKYYTEDSVKNQEKINVDSFFVDITPPLTLAKFKEAKYGNVLSAQSRIELKASDNLAGTAAIYYYFDENKEKKYTRVISSSDFRKLSEGKHVLHYYSIDNVGNKEHVKSVNISLDHTPPEVNLIVIGPQRKTTNTIYISKNSILRIDANETKTELDKIKYSIGGIRNKEYSNKIDFPKTNGNYLLSYHAVDKVENTNKKSINIYVDNLVPESKISFQGLVFYLDGKMVVSNKTSIVLKSTDNASGIQKIYYNAGAGNRKYTKPFYLNGNGNKTISYYAVDNVSNKEVKKTEAVIVDNKPPEIKVVITPKSEQDEAGVYTVSPYSLVHITSSDETAGILGVFYTINDGEKNVYRKPISQFTKGDKVTIKITANDRVGNHTEKTIILNVK